MALSTCPGCGIELPEVDGPTHPYIRSSPACWAMHGEVLARDYQNVQLRPVHQLVVDAYAVQHPGMPERRSAQSVGLHLMTLCLFMERGFDPADGSRLHQKIMARPPDFFWLEPPPTRGEITVVDVHEAPDAEGHIAMARAWARSAWDAWAPHHPTVRGWLDAY